MSADPRAARRARLVEALDDDLGALVVTHPANVRYLTGYVGSNGIAIVGRDGASLLTDFRYKSSAAEQLDAACELVIRPRDMLAGVPDAAAVVAAGGGIAFEGAHISFQQGSRLSQLLRDAGHQAASRADLVEGLRVVKDADEVAAIRRSAEVTDAALQRVLAGGLVGRRERDVAWDLLTALHDLGAEGPSFEPIVAAAANGAKPHAMPGDDPIPAGTLVTIDMGAIVDGYCSDMTRTVATGPLDAKLTEIEAVCARAQQAALDATRAGVGCKELDAVARGVITEAGYGEEFGHGLGHGVGLEIHEAPRVSSEGTGELASGMVVTIEPGIYVEGVGGVRIEDLVVVTHDGCEVLSKTSKDPAILLAGS
ncbi:MAG: M24 family metallopeptidase [Actinobacteria bacterium]|nr:aminopeptidase P family protein [Thermoleophilia bacterium]MCB9012260.1 M24 family metallopeptidase [Actinomycetota bacterium]